MPFISPPTGGPDEGAGAVLKRRHGTIAILILVTLSACAPSAFRNPVDLGNGFSFVGFNSGDQTVRFNTVPNSYGSTR